MSQHDGCKWEKACEWASNILAKLLCRWGELPMENRFETIKSVMEALDGESNERLKAAGHCAPPIVHFNADAPITPERLMRLEALALENKKLREDALISVMVPEQRVNACWAAICEACSRYGVGISGASGEDDKGLGRVQLECGACVAYREGLSAVM